MRGENNGSRGWPDRFWAKVEFGLLNDCWLWSGSTTGNKYPYGQIRYKGKLYLVHRVSYELQYGPIPLDLEIDHVCETRLCVNPFHLEAVTQEENERRTRNKFCKRGHDKQGKVRCLICQKERYDPSIRKLRYQEGRG